MLTPYTKIRDTSEYVAIVEFYGDRCAERSRVPLINHIHEGLVVLDEINASLHSMQAWCLHPLLQSDKDLAQTVQRLGPFWEFDAHAILLAMEYRYRANAWLSDKVSRKPAMNRNGKLTSEIAQVGKPTPGDLEEVWHMLIADKVQNRKDFLAHHLNTHERSAELVAYFRAWLDALDVDGPEYDRLCGAIDAAKNAP